jgi:hypothetical protein
MSERAQERAEPERSLARWVVPAVVAGLVLLVLVAVSSRYPLPVLIGARPVPLDAALALGAALLAVAAMADPEVRKPRVSMTKRQLFGLLVWWTGVFVVVALLEFASWKAWSVAALFCAIAVLVKIVQVGSHFDWNISLKLWMPFAAIMAFFIIFIAMGQFLGRPNLPPPITSALEAYGPGEPSLEPATRPAPDLSAIGAQLVRTGDRDLGGLPVTLFTYDVHGSGVDIYEANIGFPAPQGSVAADDPPGWWAELDGTALRTGPHGTNFLVVAWSTTVADRIAGTLTGQG